MKRVKNKLFEQKYKNKQIFGVAQKSFKKLHCRIYTEKKIEVLKQLFKGSVLVKKK